MSSNERTCEWVRDRIDACLDGELSDADRAELARHAESCAECAHELSLATRVLAGFRDLAIPAAPASVIERAEAEIESGRGRVVRIRPRARALRWIPAAAAAVLLLTAVWIDRERRRAAEQVAIEEAARDAAVAFAYLNKYARRAGDIVEDDVIQRRLIAPVEKAMEKSGVTETKADAGQS